MMIQAGDRVVCTGDSITDMGRARPVGEANYGGLGNGWVLFADAIWKSERPDLGLRVMNTGIGGHTTRDLIARFGSDCLDLKPDVVTIMIGTNDVWRQFDAPTKPEAGVSPEDYRANLAAMAQQAKGVAREVLLMTPFFIEPSKADAMRRRMDEYGAIVREVAATHECRFLNVQALFDRLLVHVHSSAIAGDRVHPDHVGHMAIARGAVNALR